MNRRQREKEINKQLKGRLLYLGVLVSTSNNVLEDWAIAVYSLVPKLFSGKGGVSAGRMQSLDWT